MRHTRTFKHHPTLALITVLTSMLLLLGACAEMTTPTPAPVGTTAPALTMAATTAPGATAAQVGAPPLATTVATVTPAPTVEPTLPPTALPPTTGPAPTATATAAVAPTATATVLPTATRVAPTATAPRTVVPTPGKADSKADGVGVSILAVNGALPGKNANVTIQTSPLVECGIVYIVPGGAASTAKGLEKKTSDDNGRITWTWAIGQNTRPGKGSVKVTCGDSTETAPITIG